VGSDPFLNSRSEQQLVALAARGQLGFNWQVSNFVLGVEWDFDGVANNNNTGAVFFPAVGTIQASNNSWITTLAARFGVTNGHWLFYGKAGGGWVGSDDFTVTNPRTVTSISAFNNKPNSGWPGGRGHRVGLPAQLVGEGRV
jgi:outer membrane immunogenic protein